MPKPPIEESPIQGEPTKINRLPKRMRRQRFPWAIVYVAAFICGLATSRASSLHDEKPAVKPVPECQAR